MLGHDAFDKLGPPRAHQPVKPDDFALSDGQADVIDCMAATGAGQGDGFGAKHLGPEIGRGQTGKFLRPLTDHRADDPGDVHARHRAVAGDQPVAQDGDVVADPDQLVQPVTDVDDPHAIRRKVADHAEQDLDLGRRKGAGRLVQDQDSGVLRQRLGDLDDLLLADAQMPKGSVRVDLLLQPPHQRRRRLPLKSGVDVDPGAQGFATDEDVFRHRQVRKQVQLLKHDADALCHRVGFRPEHHLAPVHQDLALGQGFDPGDDLHQSGFARAVFAHQHVDRAHAQIEVHAFQGTGAGIDLDATPDLQADPAHRVTSITVTSQGSLAAFSVTAPVKPSTCPTRSPSGRVTIGDTRSLIARPSLANSIWSRKSLKS